MPAPARLHRAREGRDAVEDTDQVDRQDAVERVRVHIGEPLAVGRDAGVVDSTSTGPNAASASALARAQPSRSRVSSTCPRKFLPRSASTAASVSSLMSAIVTLSAARRQRIGDAESDTARAAGDECVVRVCQGSSRCLSLPASAAAPPLPLIVSAARSPDHTQSPSDSPLT